MFVAIIYYLDVLSYQKGYDYYYFSFVLQAIDNNGHKDEITSIAMATTMRHEIASM